MENIWATSVRICSIFKPSNEFPWLQVSCFSAWAISRNMAARGWHGVPPAATLEKLTFWTQNYGGLEYDDVPDFNCWVTFWGEPAWIFFPREELRSNKFPVRITTTPGPLHVHSSDRHLRQKSTRPPPSNDHHYGQPTSRKRFRRSVLFHWSCWCLENLRPKKEKRVENNRK